jgi:hypothetical protein
MTDIRTAPAFILRGTDGAFDHDVTFYPRGEVVTVLHTFYGSHRLASGGRVNDERVCEISLADARALWKHLIGMGYSRV